MRAAMPVNALPNNQAAAGMGTGCISESKWTSPFKKNEACPC